jgi:hypothetical protein
MLCLNPFFFLKSWVVTALRWAKIRLQGLSCLVCMHSVCVCVCVCACVCVCTVCVCV